MTRGDVVNKYGDERPKMRSARHDVRNSFVQAENRTTKRSPQDQHDGPKEHEVHPSILLDASRRSQPRQQQKLNQLETAATLKLSPLPPFSIHSLHEKMLTSSPMTLGGDDSPPPTSLQLMSAAAAAAVTTSTTTPATTTPDVPLDCSSASPTNTSGSEASALSTTEMISLLTTASTPTSSIKQEPSMTPMFTDATTLFQLSQLFQTQHVAAQLQAHVVQQQRQHIQQQTQQNGSVERKRSYPCTFQFCALCRKDVHSSKLPCHIRQCHVAKPMFQCPACDFTSTYSKNNVKSHMVSLHGLAGDPISYMEKYASQVEEYMKLCFPNVRGRGRPMQGRLSPKSPVSPPQSTTRRTSQVFNKGHVAPTMRRPMNAVDIFALAHQQQVIAAQQYNSLRRFSPLPSIFPAVVVNNNNNTTDTSMSDIKPLAVLDKEDDVAHSVSLDDLVNSSHGVRMESQASSGQATSSTPLTTYAALQPVRPGENIQPRYLMTALTWTVLSGEQVRNTIFEEAPTRPNLDNVDKLNAAVGDSSDDDVESPFLSVAQAETIESVRSRIGMQSFEIKFAVHRLDLNVLPTELVQLVAAIAPTRADVVRLKSLQAQNVRLGDNERFLLSLDEVDRLEEKLRTMLHMGTFKKQADFITESLATMGTAARVLTNSEAFRGLVHLVLTLANVAVIGDRTLTAINGFRVSQMHELCNHLLPSGVRLFNILVVALRTDFRHLKDAFELCEILANAGRVPFSDVSLALCRLEEMNVATERELEQCGPSLAHVGEFVAQSRVQTLAVVDDYVATKEELVRVMCYIGEPVPRLDEPLAIDVVFQKVADFLGQLQAAVDDADVDVSSP